MPVLNGSDSAVGVILAVDLTSHASSSVGHMRVLICVDMCCEVG